MYHRIKKYLFLFAGLALFSQAESQFTSQWLAAGLEYKLPANFSIEGSLEARAMQDRGFFINKYFTQAAVNYKISKHFDLSVKYRYTQRIEDNFHYYPRHRLMLDLRSDFPVERLKVNYRGRYQRIYRTYIDSELDAIPAQILRNRFIISYNLRHSPLTPSVGAEVFSPLNGFAPGVIDETRIMAGIEYPLSKKHTLDIGLLYIRERFSTQNSNLVLDISYNYTLN